MKSLHRTCISIISALVLSSEALAEGSYEISVVNGDVVINNFSRKSHNPKTIVKRGRSNQIVEIQNEYLVNNYYEQPYAIYSHRTVFDNGPCWYQLDPYTFLGDIFGYDYDYVCR